MILFFFYGLDLLGSLCWPVIGGNDTLIWINIYIDLLSDQQSNNPIEYNL